MKPAVSSATATLLSLPIALALAPTAATAPPPGFPDLNNFNSVDSHPYDVMEHSGSTQEFKADSGIRCDINGYIGMSCTVPFAVPDLAPSTTGPDCTFVAGNAIPADPNSPRPYQFKRQQNPCPSDDNHKLLPPGRKITYDAHGTTYFTCATDSTFVACIDRHDHGFVLQPSSSWTF
ncbi:hypothetical protein BOO86_18620 [Mycobacterium sp. CBMA 234]|uniref:hypothetical protein n=1 Tax=Mycolicibacterium sp. CBMA 234 TaxID=1918495 RepID=UPI0012DEEEC6|nr:hypothetical protein [Mycolicibacterium sp. CBMA 234]MUL66495.1 hypothetical protein [Mycolicibacterium sp. CBMA 234]